MKRIMLTVIALSLATVAQAEGDIDAGKKTFGKCKVCHEVVTPEGEVLVKGKRTGPNLYGVIGRAAGTVDFGYTKTFKKFAESGFVWTEETLAEFVEHPRGFLKAQGTDGKTRMTYKLKKGGADVAAYLASLNPEPEVTEEAPEETAEAAATE